MIIIEFNVTVIGTVEAFNSTDFQHRVATTLSIPPADISLQVYAASVVVCSRITVNDGVSAANVIASVEALAYVLSLASAVLGVSVEDITQPLASAMLVPVPSPRPPVFPSSPLPPSLPPPIRPPLPDLPSRPAPASLGAVASQAVTRADEASTPTAAIATITAAGASLVVMLVSWCNYLRKRRAKRRIKPDARQDKVIPTQVRPSPPLQTFNPTRTPAWFDYLRKRRSQRRIKPDMRQDTCVPTRVRPLPPTATCSSTPHRLLPLKGVRRVQVLPAPGTLSSAVCAGREEQANAENERVATLTSPPPAPKETRPGQTEQMGTCLQTVPARTFDAPEAARGSADETGSTDASSCIHVPRFEISQSELISGSLLPTPGGLYGSRPPPASGSLPPLFPEDDDWSRQPRRVLGRNLTAQPHPSSDASFSISALPSVPGAIPFAQEPFGKGERTPKDVRAPQPPRAETRRLPPSTHSSATLVPCQRTAPCSAQMITQGTQPRHVRHRGAPQLAQRARVTPSAPSQSVPPPPQQQPPPRSSPRPSPLPYPLRQVLQPSTTTTTEEAMQASTEETTPNPPSPQSTRTGVIPHRRAPQLPVGVHFAPCFTTRSCASPSPPSSPPSAEPSPREKDADSTFSDKIERDFASMVSYMDGKKCNRIGNRIRRAWQHDSKPLESLFYSASPHGW